MYKDFYQKRFFFSTIGVSQAAIFWCCCLPQWVLYIRVAGAKPACFAKLVNILCSLAMSYVTWLPTAYNIRTSNEVSASFYASNCGSILIAAGSWSNVVKFFSMVQELMIAGSLDFIGAFFGSSFFGKAFESIVFDENCIGIFLIRNFIFYYYVIKGFFFLLLPFFGGFCTAFMLFLIF